MLTHRADAAIAAQSKMIAHVITTPFFCTLPVAITSTPPERDLCSGVPGTEVSYAGKAHNATEPAKPSDNYDLTDDNEPSVAEPSP